MVPSAPIAGISISGGLTSLAAKRRRRSIYGESVNHPRAWAKLQSIAAVKAISRQLKPIKSRVIASQLFT